MNYQFKPNQIKSIQIKSSILLGGPKGSERISILCEMFEEEEEI